MPASGQAVSDQFWIKGVNSLLDPTNLAPGEYQWGDNVANRSGLISTRPGFAIVGSIIADLGEPQGIALFTPKNRTTQIIVAVGGKILVSEFPYLTYTKIDELELKFSPKAPQIAFKNCLKSIEQGVDGYLKVIPSVPLLIIQDGLSRAGVWDGVKGRHLDPSNTPAAFETPGGLWMEWIGSRLWVASGHRLYASNLADPLKFTETGYLAEGGFFNLPGKIMGMSTTPDLHSLLVGTNTTMTSFQASILDCLKWSQTPEFQKLILPGIGVVGGKSFFNQYGLTWWMSHDGLVGLDNALQTYQSSSIHFRDRLMMRSKSNLSSDLSGVCLGGYENFMMCSVPSGDSHNAHTWVMDSSPTETLQRNGDPAWSGTWRGIRPVEWVTGVVNGENRCFCLSRDYKPVDTSLNRRLRAKPTDFVYNVWEGFISERADVGHNGSMKRIECAFETKFYGEGFMLKKFSFAQLDLTEISGIVDIEVYYAGLKGGYERILEKRIVATTGSIGSPMILTIDKDTVIESFRPQDRMIRTVSIKGGRAANNQNGVESKYNRDQDRAFSLLIRWTGQMAIRSLRAYIEAVPEETQGTCEPDESIEQAITIEGRGLTSYVAAIERPLAISPRSHYFRAITPRYAELPYESLTLAMLLPETLQTDERFTPTYPVLPVRAAGTVTQWIDALPPLPPPTPPPPVDSDEPNPGFRDSRPPGWPANHPDFKYNPPPNDP